MANWCENKLEIRGKEDELEKFIEALIGTDEDGYKCFEFSQLYPTPSDLGDREVEWCYENWGCFSVGFGPDYDIDDDQLICDFMTKWSPPDAFVIYLAKKHPDWKITLRYNSEESDFQGRLVCNHGEVVSHEILDWAA